MPENLRSIIRELNQVEQAARNAERSLRDLQSQAASAIAANTSPLPTNMKVPYLPDLGKINKLLQEVASGQRTSIAGANVGGIYRVTRNEGELSYINSIITKYKEQYAVLNSLKAKQQELNSTINITRENFAKTGGRLAEADLEQYNQELAKTRTVADNVRTAINALTNDVIELVYQSRQYRPFDTERLRGIIGSVVAGQRQSIAGAVLVPGDEFSKSERITRAKLYADEMNALVNAIVKLEAEFTKLTAIQDTIISKIVRTTREYNAAVYAGTRQANIPQLPPGNVPPAILSLPARESYPRLPAPPAYPQLPPSFDRSFLMTTPSGPTIYGRPPIVPTQPIPLLPPGRPAVNVLQPGLNAILTPFTDAIRRVTGRLAEEGQVTQSTVALMRQNEEQLRGITKDQLAARQMMARALPTTVGAEEEFNHQLAMAIRAREQGAGTKYGVYGGLIGPSTLQQATAKELPYYIKKTPIGTLGGVTLEQAEMVRKQFNEDDLIGVSLRINEWVGSLKGVDAALGKILSERLEKILPVMDMINNSTAQLSGNIENAANGYKLVTQQIEGARGKTTERLAYAPTNFPGQKPGWQEIPVSTYFKEGVIAPEIERISGLSKAIKQQLVGELTNVGQLVDSAFTDMGENISGVTVKAQLLNKDLMSVRATFTDMAGVQKEVNRYILEGNQILNEEQLAIEMVNRRTEAQIRLLDERIGVAARENVIAQAEQRGFSAYDIKKIRTQQPTGITFVDMEQVDKETGSVTKLQMAVSKIGEVMPITNRRLQGFTESIIRNTGELIKWSIGIGLVYGTYYKFQQLLQLAISNQTKLIDVTVTLGNTQRDVNAIFDDAAKVAEKTGESITEVLDTYTMAYRAVGGIVDPIQRTSAANKLLYDSTVLNKLANLDASESIDVLSAALRQTATREEDAASSFDRGTEMLDKWVAVTLRANVDLATLSTAFSVTAESALNAGTSIEELNAIIAVLSEKIGGLGGKETGNAVRALIGGVYQQQAADILNKFGIAVTDSNDKMREFMAISKDIYDLYRAGLIDEGQLNKIAYTLGGGVRRGQQYVAFLKDYQRIQEIVVVQENAGGVAAEALAKKMETVQTSSTKLSNAFQKLAQTLGTKGGFLDSITGINEALSWTVNILNDISKVIGSFAIPAALLAILELGFGKGFVGQAKINTPFTWLGGAITGLGNRGLYGMQGGIIGPAAQAATGLRNTPTDYLRESLRGVGGFVGSYGLAMAVGLAGASPRISSALQGEGKWEAAGADIAGSIIGGVLGAAAGPQGAAIGALIGGAIADALYQNVVAYEPQFEELFKPVFQPKPGEKAPGPEETRQQFATRRIYEEYANLLGPNYSREAAESTAKTLTIGVNALSAVLNQGIKLEPTQFALAEVARNRGMGSPEYKELIRLIQEGNKFAPGKEIPYEETKLYEFEKKGQEVFGEYLDSLTKQARDKLTQQMLTGEISPTEYTKRIEDLGGASSKVIRSFGAVNDLNLESIKLTEQNKIVLEDYFNVLTSGNEESIALVNKLVAQYFDWGKVVEENAGKGNVWLEAQGMYLNDLIKQWEALPDAITNVGKAMDTAVPQGFQLPTITPIQGVSKKQFDQFYQDALKQQDIYIKWMRTKVEEGLIPGITSVEQFDNAVAQILKSAVPLFYDLGKEGGIQVAAGLTESGYIQDSLQKAISEGMSNLSYDFMDVTYEQFMSIQSQYEQLRQNLINAATIAGMPNPESVSPETPQLVTFANDPTNPMLMTKDWKLVQYLLQQILKTEEKQLDGMYNLPSGASFYVPYQAWKMDTETRKAMNQPTATTPYDMATPVSNFSAAVDRFGNVITTLGQIKTLFYPEQGIYSLNDIKEQFYPKEGIPQIESSKIQQSIQNYVQDSILNFNKDINKIQPYKTPLASTTDQNALYTPMGGVNFLSPIVTDTLVNLISKLDIIFGGQTTLEGRDIVGQMQGIVTPGQALSETTIRPLGEIIKEAIDSGLKDFGTKIDNQVNAINTFIESIKQSLGVGMNTQTPQTGVPQTNIPEVSTDLKINLQAQTQLVVDGQMLANVVKQYLWADLVAYQNTSGGTTGTFTAV